MDGPVGRSSTPPLYPKYGVHFSEAQITTIVQQSLQNTSLQLSISTLLSDQSFNNRIYFIDFSNEAGQYVLKVNGRFFGGAKIENEVCCLLLLNQFCPELPVPRVVS